MVAVLALLVGNYLAERFKLTAPLVLIVIGAVITLIAGEPLVSVGPEIVISVFLPILLYWEALNISLRGIRRSLRGIILNGTLMVVFVAVAVGVVGQWLGLALGTALLIGASIGPTDATSVAALGKGINPHGQLILRAESLINDGTALVIFALALEYASGAAIITPGHVLSAFLISFVGGALSGLVVGFVAHRLGVYVTDYPMVANLFRILCPFLSFFVAEEFGASGALAVVVCGLYIAQVAPRFVSTGSRVLAGPFWGLTTYLINGVLFLLVGIYLPVTVETLFSDNWTHAIIVAIVLYLVMVLARWVFGEVAIHMIRLLDRRPSQRQRRTTLRERMVITIAGFRGAISLAVAFSIPETLASGEPFPNRDLIIFVTSVIVILSLVVQGFLLPRVVAWASAKPNPNRTESVTQEDEVRQAHIDSARDILARWDQIVAEAEDSLEYELSSEAIEVVRNEIAKIEHIHSGEDSDEYSAKIAKEAADETTLRLVILQQTRSNYINMRDTGAIDDETLTRLLSVTDIEELRMTGPIEME